MSGRPGRPLAPAAGTEPSQPPVYVWDRAWRHERERLEVQAGLWDLGTRRHLQELGLGPGWRCAEVGAGAGSVARWMCERVGDAGRVVATDLDTRFLAGCEHPSLEIRQHDIVAGPLELASYDLAHTRLVLMHLPQREQALRHMIAALKPGGCLLVEDYDMSTSRWFHPASELQTRVADAVISLLQSAGADTHYGTKLPSALASAGLVDVAAQARAPLVRLGSPQVEALALKLEQFGPKLVASGLVTEQEVARAIGEVRQPSAAVCYPPLMVAAWGRRP